MVFFFNDTATTEIYTLSLHDALPIFGFSQSYTYFTWRNGKAELTEYLEELADGPARDFFRPHFFVNTPDINPPFLQTGGRSEEDTSELQSRQYLVCRLLLVKKKIISF